MLRDIPSTLVDGIVLGEARSAPRWVLSRLKVLFYFYFGKIIKMVSI